MLLELFDTDSRLMMFLCPESGEVYLLLVSGFIYLTSNPQCCIPWFLLLYTYVARIILSTSETVIQGKAGRDILVIVEAAYYKFWPHKTVAVRPLTSYLTNYSRKTKKICRALLNPEATFSYRILHMECLYWPTSKDLNQLWADTGCSQKNLPQSMNNWDGWRERVRKHRSDRIDFRSIIMVYFTKPQLYWLCGEQEIMYQ